jgi:hypothetical protein
MVAMAVFLAQSAKNTAADLPFHGNSQRATESSTNKKE